MWIKLEKCFKFVCMGFKSNIEKYIFYAARGIIMHFQSGSQDYLDW